MDSVAVKRLRTVWELLFSYAFIASAGMMIRGGTQPHLVLSLLILWSLLFVVSYVVGSYDLEVGPAYGLRLRTQFVFLVSALAYLLFARFVWRDIVFFPYGFWIALFLYLNLLSPLLGLAVGRLYRLSTLCVTDSLTEPDQKTFANWGYVCQSVVPHDRLTDWLKANSDERNRPRGYETVLIDLRNAHREDQALALSRQFFVEFAGVRATSLWSYVRGRHCRRISFMPLGGINHRIKRIVDLVLSLVALIILSPFLLFVAVAIKADSPGPVFFKHRRLGKDMKYFWLLKFRTMYQDAEKRLQDILAQDPIRRKEFETTYKLRDDPRVTRIGRLLRSTSLDEVPQLFNIIKDQMSWVGPRPIVAGEIPFYKSCDLMPFRVMPGATGLWQISGRNDTGYERRVALDLEYIKGWSYWRDVKILFATLPAVISRRGAY